MLDCEQIGSFPDAFSKPTNNNSEFLHEVSKTAFYFLLIKLSMSSFTLDLKCLTIEIHKIWKRFNLKANKP